jgi:hypothetical protein
LLLLSDAGDWRAAFSLLKQKPEKK